MKSYSSPLFLVIGMIFLIITSLTGQNNFDYCHVTYPEGSSLNNDDNTCPDSYLYAPDIDNLDHTPIITINVNFHFILNDNCEGNFKPPEDAEPTLKDNGVLVAQHLVDNMNEHMANLNAYNFNPSTPHITDARIRFRLYTDVTDADDQYGGVWFHCNDNHFDRPITGFSTLSNLYSYYNEKVIDIYMFASNNGSACLGGVAQFGDTDGVKICGGFYHQNTTDPDPKKDHSLEEYIDICIHEIGHSLRLEHSFYCRNECIDRTDDLVGSLECDESGTGNMCDSAFNGSDDCPNRYDSPSNNFMEHGVEAKNFTPCQLGIIHETLVSGRECINDEICIANGDIVIETGENFTWEGGKRIDKNIVIKRGGRLEIRCRIRMPENGRIIVEHGGELFINDGLISSDCGGFWEGIEVRGHPSELQTNLAETGRLILEDASLINARTAISTSGLITINNTSFTNNKSSIEFLAYPNFDNMSTVSNCEFKRTRTGYPELSQEVSPHVTLFDNVGVMFTNCEFRDNLKVSSLAGEQWKNLKGILSIESDYIVNNSVFKGLYIGIDYTGSHDDSRTHQLQVVGSDSEFNCEYIGIATCFADNVVVRESDFFIGRNHLSDPFTISRGIYHYIGTDYEFEDNFFTSPATGKNFIGLMIDNGADEANVAQNNIFDGLTYGNTAHGINRSSSSSGSGLVYNCMTNQNVALDFFIFANNNEPSSGIGVVQDGENGVKPPTNNVFTKNRNSNFAIKDIWNTAENGFSYYHDNSNIQRPDSYSSNISLFERDIDGSCQSTAQLSQAEAIARHQIARIQSGEIRNALNALLDGNKTLELIREIVEMLDGQDFPVITEIYSPYLTTRVLTAAAQRRDIITNDMLKAAVIANPDVLRSRSFINLLTTMDNPMSATDMEEILSHRNDYTERTEMEHNLAAADSEVDAMANVVLRHLYAQEELDYVEIREWLASKESVHSDYAIAGTYFVTTDFATGLNHLQTMPNRFALSDLQMAELNRYIELKQFQQNIIDQGRNMQSLNESEISHLQTYILDYPERTSVYVQNLLNFFYGYHYDWRIIELPTEEENLQHDPMSRSMTTTTGIAETSLVTAYPNPANEIVNFSFATLESNNTRIQMTNLYGTVVQEISIANGATTVQWNTENASEGVYFYHLLEGDKVLETNRILLIK